MHNTELGNAFGGAVNYHHYSSRPVLISMPVDRAALWVEQNEFEAIKSKWREILSRAYPGKDIEFKNFTTTRWFQDPFSQGSYSFVPVGANAMLFDALPREVGKIHFAGEATTIQQHGTVHGAYNSGVREAIKIISM